MNIDYYIDDKIYARLVEELARLRLSLNGHADIEDAIRWTLGEAGGVWPASIKALDGEAVDDAA